MTYYYAPYDDYRGFYPRKKASTLKGAFAGLRKAMKEEGSESGIICTRELPNHPVSRNPPGYFGSVQVMAGRLIHFNFNGKKVPGYEDEYVWFKKGSRSSRYKILANGDLGIREKYKRKV